jgi:hypothetical protein
MQDDGIYQAGTQKPHCLSLVVAVPRAPRSLDLLFALNYILLGWIDALVAPCERLRVVRALIGKFVQSEHAPCSKAAGKGYCRLNSTYLLGLFASVICSL